VDIWVQLTLPFRNVGAIPYIFWLVGAAFVVKETIPLKWLCDTTRLFRIN